MLFTWLGKRSLFMATDDWSPVQSIRLVLVFSQKRKRGWLLPCFCVVGVGLCQPCLQWLHLSLGAVAASPRKELKSFSVPFSPCGSQRAGWDFRAGTMLSYRCCPRSRAGCGQGGGCQVVPEWCSGHCLSCQSQIKLSHWGGLPAARFVAVSGKSDSVYDSKGKEGISLNCSFSNNGLFCWIFFYTV